MDSIRDHVLYKNTPITICLSKLTPQEQYELVRVLLEAKCDVSICTHDGNNQPVVSVLRKLNFKFVQCWKEEILPAT
jgi:hypothetical protein